MSDLVTTTLPRADLLELLHRAVYAPSGDNSQPWRFRVEENSILLLNQPDADETQYNYKQRGSYFAHGAVIENLSLLAGERGYKLDIELFPPLPDVTARIMFRPTVVVHSPLIAAIPLRATNRKPYKETSLDQSHQRALLDSVPRDGEVTVRFVEDKKTITLLAQTVSVNERLLMENRPLHDFLFGMIRWTQAEERAKPGLYVKTMEFPLPVQVMFRYVLYKWTVVRTLNFIGLSRFIPKQSAPVYRASSAFGAVIITGENSGDYVEAGRLFQRLWLTATSLGISIQPVTAIPYLGARVACGAATAFSSAHQKMIQHANKVISDTFHVIRPESIAMLFRVGYGEDPSAISLKIPPIILE